MKERYMKLALVEAKKAFEIGEVPVGAVIVKDDIVLAKSYNKKEKELQLVMLKLMLLIKLPKKYLIGD